MKDVFARDPGQLQEAVKKGYMPCDDELLALYESPLSDLCGAADELRRFFCGQKFDLCTIVSARSGACSEDCHFCAQSAHHKTAAPVHGMLSAEALLADARRQQAAGIPRYSLVTSGRTLSKEDLAHVCAAVRLIVEETGLFVCGSFGLLTEEDCRALAAAGLQRIHNNLEASRRFFPEICSTHTTDDKLATIAAARAAGLSVCSGGIIGLGETRLDRIALARELRALDIRSVPVNVLTAISGTPLAGRTPLTHEEILRTIAVFRFILPEAHIRLAGGRALFPDRGEKAFQSGANATITGDMLTTAGISTATDLEMLDALGYEISTAS